MEIHDPVHCFSAYPFVGDEYEHSTSQSSPMYCPSLSRSFSSSNISFTDPHNVEKSSFGSCSASPPTATLSTSPTSMTSPTTPTTIAPGAIMNPRGSFQSQDKFHDTNLYNLCRTVTEFNDYEWLNEADSLDQLAQMDNFVPATAYTNQPQCFTEYSSCLNGQSNPAFSRPMFADQAETYVHAYTGSDNKQWPISSASLTLQTITPSAAFQPALMSSPLVKNEPSTPVKSRYGSSVILSSSPCSVLSPPVLPSQHESLDWVYSPSSDHEPDVETKLYHSKTDRLQRRTYEKKTCGASNKPKPARGNTGITCDALIPSNPFPCSFPGCVDRQNRPKRFKRQEHKKRHERTVHGRGEYELFSCWVPSCTTVPFTRKDNLNAHQNNTHGRKSSKQRTSYIATLDRTSVFYDPSYRGPFDKNGLPIR